MSGSSGGAASGPSTSTGRSWRRTRQARSGRPGGRGRRWRPAPRTRRGRWPSKRRFSSCGACALLADRVDGGERLDVLALEPRDGGEGTGDGVSQTPEVRVGEDVARQRDERGIVLLVDAEDGEDPPEALERLVEAIGPRRRPAGPALGEVADQAERDL